jgi:hypothetical protein
MEQRRRRPIIPVLMPAILGLIFFFTVISRPRFQIYHTVDVLQLLATGMLLGATLAGLLRILRGRGQT